MTSKTRYALLVVMTVVVFAVSMIAQDTSKTTVTQQHERATITAEVEQGEVVYVSGNELVVKGADGQVRHITVAPGATAVVDGKTITIKDVVPGMKLQRTIKTTTTPEVVTTVRTIQGKVWYVNAPSTIILTLPEGNKQYKVPRDQIFMVDGEKKTVFEIRKGMNVTATVLTQVSQSAIAQQKEVSGSMPAPPETPAMEGALLVETAAPAPMVAKAEMPTTLPKTGSILPLIGLLGLLSLAGSFAVRRFR